ncbi:MAG: DUF5107 domain-containing protein, partial [Planctomycetes bacterium]|nr:DUF5107 domain-containing protein [Planctomycetota bacterium]
LWIGETERRHGMRLDISMTVRPGSSRLEVAIEPYNRTGLVSSFLYFANPAVHVDETYQVIFPPNVQYVTQHAKREFATWPVANGRYGGRRYDGVDISWWKNLPHPVSFFAWNYETDYFAGYDHGKEAGVAYIANHHIAPGMKFFTFGCGAPGKIWDRMLTDEDGPYLELMAGAYSDNQPDYSWIQPYEAKCVRQHWFPMRKLGGLKYANLSGALNLEVEREGAARIRINTTSRHEGARVELRRGGDLVFEDVAEIAPDRPYGRDVPIGSDVPETELEVMVRGAGGGVLLRYRPSPRADAPMPEAVRPPRKPEEIQTVEELYLAGLRLTQFHNAQIDPHPYYEEALRRDPGHYDTNTQLGILCCGRMMWEEAEERLRAAIARVTREHTYPRRGEAHYYLGIALRGQGRLEDAYDAFYQATWSFAWHAAAYYQLAEIDSLRGDLDRALARVDRSISTNSSSVKALVLRAVLLRKLGRLDAALRQAKDAAGRRPLDFQARNELRLLALARGESALADAERAELARLLREDVESYLQLAVDYGSAGFLDEAIEVLGWRDRTRSAEHFRHPMLYYFLGCYHDRKGDGDAALRYYRLASTMDPEYCFPWRAESLAVLEHALARNPGDARGLCYLGNLLYDHQPERAIAAWEKSRDIDGSMAVVHRNLGYAYWQRKNDLAGAVESLERAVALRPGDPRLYYELDVLYEHRKAPMEKRLALLDSRPEVIEQRDDAMERKVIACIQAGRYGDAIPILRARHFHRWEGGGRIRELYADAHLLRGLELLRAGRSEAALNDFEAALEYPENLDMGRPESDRRFAQIHYLIGAAHEALGHGEKAEEHFRRCVSEGAGGSEYLYEQALGWRELGEDGKASASLDRLEELARSGSDRIDFFAKFGEKEEREKRQARSHYLQALALLGKRSDEDFARKARAELEKALELDPYHRWAVARLEELPAGTSIRPLNGPSARSRSGEEDESQ